MTLQLDNPAVLFLIFAGFSIWTGVCWSIGDENKYGIPEAIVFAPLILGLIGTIISLGYLVLNSL